MLVLLTLFILHFNFGKHKKTKITVSTKVIECAKEIKVFRTYHQKDDRLTYIG